MKIKSSKEALSIKRTTVSCLFVLSPAPGAVALQISSTFLTLHQVAFAANHPQLVLVGRGQVDGSGGDGRAQVAWVWDVQVCVRVWPGKTQEAFK